MQKTITILLGATVFMFALGLVFSAMIISELTTEVRVQKALNKVCEADRMWKEIQIRDLGAEPR